MTTAAVIGCGDVSIVHFGALAALPEVQLVAVCDTNTERLMAAVEDEVEIVTERATLNLREDLAINRPIRRPRP